MKKWIWTAVVPVSIIGVSAFLSHLWNISKLPIHWNIKGEADSFASPLTFFVFMFAVILILNVVAHLYKYIEPLRKKVEEREREWFKFFGITLTFLSMASIVSVLWGRVKGFHPLFLWLGLFFIIIGNELPQLPRNFFAGIRLPWTLTNEENWRKVHRISGYLFVLLGLVLLIQGLTNEVYPTASAIGLGIVILIPMVMSIAIHIKTKRIEDQS